MKSVQLKDGKQLPPDDPGGNPTVNFRGQRRSNRTHSKTDLDARLARKGLVENRNGLIMSPMAWEATGTAERDTALLMLEQVPGDGRITAGGDKGSDTREFVRECLHMNVTPRVVQNHGRSGGSSVDGRTARHESYRISQRKRIEECFGWLKTIALLRKMRHRGLLKVDWVFAFACAAYNLVRMRNLTVQPG